MLAESTPLIVTGMHRSGTSLAASLLQAVGVNMGEKLLGPNIGNVKGHFEDLDFLYLHEGILRSHGLDSVGWIVPQGIAPTDTDRTLAQELLAKKMAAAVGHHWGWKDPRTTLFLNFWNELIPDAGWIFIYRSPWDVMDSLARRGTDPTLAQDPILAIACWVYYNASLLDFMRAHSDRCLLVCNDAVAANPDEFITRVSEFFAVPLQPLTKNLFDPTIMHARPRDSWQASVVAAICPEALTLFDELQAMAAMKTPSSTNPIAADAATLGRALLLEWMGHQPLVRDHEEMRYHFDQTQRTVHHQKHQVEELQQQVLQLKTRLDDVTQHAANLEKARDEAKKHAANLEKIREESSRHIINLEGIVKRIRELAK